MSPRIDNSLHRHFTSSRGSSDIVTAAAESLPHEPSTGRTASRVAIPVDGKEVKFSAVLLRDACSCPLCVHESTNQRLFSTADIPANIEARAVEVDATSNTVNIQWNFDAPNYNDEHITKFDAEALRELHQTGSFPSRRDSFCARTLWGENPLKTLDLHDHDYRMYMEDDTTLYRLMNKLHKHGLAFVTNVPGVRESLAKIATRMGPIKDTFYGHTWDGRSTKVFKMFDAPANNNCSPDSASNYQRRIHIARSWLPHRSSILRTSTAYPISSLHPVSFCRGSKCFCRCIQSSSGSFPYGCRCF